MFQIIPIALLMRCLVTLGYVDMLGHEKTGEEIPGYDWLRVLVAESQVELLDDLVRDHRG